MKRQFFRCIILCSSFLTLFLSGCQGSSSEQSQGQNNTDTYHVGQSLVAGDLDPLNSSWSLASHGVAEYVYQQDPDGNLFSRYIDQLDHVDANTWQASSKNEAKFADGSLVDAPALAECLNEIQEKNPLSNATAGKITFTADDDSHLTIKTERPTQVMDSVLGEWTNVVYKRDGDQVIYSGPYQVKNLQSEEKVEMEPNPHYPDSDQRKNVTITAFNDEAAMKSAFQSEEMDLIAPISPNLKEQLDKSGHKTQSYDAGYQYFALVNIQKPLLQEAKMRQALDLALNRDDYLKALKGGRLPSGLFADIYSFNADVPLEQDTAKAEALLDELGWKKNDQGQREKDGQALELKVATLSFREDLVTIGQMLTSQLEPLGIQVKVEALDNAEDIKTGSPYDLLIYSQHTAPSGEPSYFLNQFFRSDGSNNRFDYSNPEVDQELDQLGQESDPAKRDAIAQSIQEKIINDRPILRLVDPEWHAGIGADLGDYQLYCGDYYIVNPSLGVNK
ncbi:MULTISPECIES: ABC transporter substrate-binding protein [Aerococcus]|uniref:ABC transporter substrate-binding protein n=1 Tax=Aerococcus mictus TaxID=2976810 RepID=A0A9Q4DFZ9_9LACT|nr:MULTISPECIES: ABC transporter substrate-binding protein [Aerococcus]AEA01400.1 ABC transporter, substrate-binding protein, family 5 [Aerococcus sp. Group 1]MCY3031299.1 ABC transporter substrate-binding protein [Aerococcus sp. Group 1]MCY3055276.1 ABC transporter substrate-binding protein [Aerococcus sp. Group 1]MCY3057006.1 ABC transporter substrate-binding protein [Aerococcus sp. Group 1]MCY3062457.1 ABC transporter substrate-binding protein [Aerococcus sp. Group 1]